MKINFVIADEIRQEIGGKQTILGLYADGTIMLEATEELNTSTTEVPRGIERLAFLVNVSDISEEKHRYKGQIICPSGLPYGEEISFGEVIIPKGKSRTIILETKPFLIKEKGTYHFNFFVDDVLYPFPFNLIEREKKGSSVS